VEDYDSLIHAVIAGDRAAWAELVGALVPHIRRMAASHKSMRARQLATAPDDVSEVTTASLERLSRDGFHNLRRYLLQREHLGARAQRFDSWLYGAVDFTIREHVRRRYGRGGRASAMQALPSKRDLSTDAGKWGEEPAALLSELGVTGRLELLQIFEYVDRHFAEPETRAMRLHYAEGLAFDELALRLGLPDAHSAERLIRKLNQRLRQRFGSKHSG
jgi:DNA-directed RNA polymerase specialized sigma24 family protein